MSSLKTFILQEAVRISHAERYLTYVERYHDEIYLEIQREVERAWSKAVDRLSSKYSVSQTDSEEALLRNQKATLQIVLSKSPEKLATARSPKPLEVDMSVKIPIILRNQERSLAMLALVKAAQDAFLKVTGKWKDVFNYEHRGKTHPSFKVTGDDDEVRLQLAVKGHGSIESFRTICSVRVEYGRTGSKTRDFDRVYLYSSV